MVSGPSLEELVATLREFGDDADNPAINVIAKIVVSLFKEQVNRKTHADKRETEINYQQLLSALNELEAIRPDVWALWMEITQAEVVARLRMAWAQ